MDPLAGLREEKLHIVKHEDVRVGHRVEFTLADLTGPGSIVSLWMALGGGNAPALDGRLRIYYDGAVTPAVDIDYGTLLASHWGAGGQHYTQHVTLDINRDSFFTGLLLTFPMPFGNRIRLAYYNPSTTQTAWLYSMATYERAETDLAFGKRLRCTGRRWLDQAVRRNAGDSTVLADIGGGPGWIVWLSYVGGLDATNDTWLERNFTIKVDGEPSPAIVASGTEDWFDSAWYFHGRKDFNVSPHSYVGTNKPANAPHAVGMATDLWSKWNGVPFQSSAIVRVESEPGCTTGDRFCWCVLFYQ